MARRVHLSQCTRCTSLQTCVFREREGESGSSPSLHPSLISPSTCLFLPFCYVSPSLPLSFSFHPPPFSPPSPTRSPAPPGDVSLSLGMLRDWVRAIMSSLSSPAWLERSEVLPLLQAAAILGVSKCVREIWRLVASEKLRCIA